MNAYTMSRTPELYCGKGVMSKLDFLLAPYSRGIMLVTGKHSFRSSGAYEYLINVASLRRIPLYHYFVSHEPSPATIDEAVRDYSPHRPDVVVALGGGSVIDAAKAIAAMMGLREPVKEYLEGVGTKSHPGTRLPFIALPTTSGTGSEATRNAVLSEVGPDGFKRSLRHLNFVADVAILDPTLSVNCPPAITAYSGMDAFTQLLEAYLSTAATPITDALAIQGLKLLCSSLPDAYLDGNNLQARLNMALASYLSGICLANAGLGTVHGLAGTLGGWRNIPHGQICSRLMAPVNRLTVRALRSTDCNAEALTRYAFVGRMFGAHGHHSDAYFIDLLLDKIESWTNDMNIPSLRQSGFTDDDLHRLAKVTDNKNNPVKLKEEEVVEALTKV